MAYPDRGAGNDPKLLFFLFVLGVGSLSPPRLSIFTVDNMGVVICLGQGGLRSLSASSSIYIFAFCLEKKSSKNICRHVQPIKTTTRVIVSK